MYQASSVNQDSEASEVNQDSEASGVNQDSDVNQASGHRNVTVCPDDYSPHDGCVTLDQLLSADLIKSNTTFTFVPATFKMTQDLVIRFENVSNITLESASAVISCDGNNAGFIFSNVSEVAVQNIQFVGCAVSHICGYENNCACTFFVIESFNITLQNLTFKVVRGCGVYADVSDGSFTLSDSLFTGLHSTGLAISIGSSLETSYLTIVNSRFQDNHCSTNPGFIACVFDIIIHHPVIIKIINVTVTNNTRTSEVLGIGIKHVFRYKPHSFRWIGVL